LLELARTSGAAGPAAAGDRESRWAAVASQLRGRSEHSVRNRFHRLQRRKARAGARGRPEEEGEARAEGGGGAAAGRCVETARVVVALIWDGAAVRLSLSAAPPSPTSPNLGQSRAISGAPSSVARRSARGAAAAAAAAAARSHRAVPVLRIVIDAMRRSVLSPVASNVASSEEVAVAACACLASTNPRAGAAAAALIDALCAAGSETVPSHFRAISKTVPTEAVRDAAAAAFTALPCAVSRGRFVRSLRGLSVEAGLLCSLLESPSIGGKQSPYFGAVDGAAASATLAEALPPLLRLRPKRPAADGVLILQGALLSCAEARGLLDGQSLTATSRAALAASCGELAAWAERHRASGHASLGSGFRHAQARLAGPE